MTSQSVFDTLYEYAKQITKTKVNIAALLKYIKHIDNLADNKYILLPTIIEYIQNLQYENSKPLDIDLIKTLSEDEQVIEIANFASIKYSNTKKTIEGLIPFIKQWELSCMSAERGPIVLHSAAEKYPRLADQLLLNLAESYPATCGIFAAPIQQDSLSSASNRLKIEIIRNFGEVNKICLMLVNI